MHSTVFFAVALFAMITEGIAILFFLFQPGLRYKIAAVSLDKLNDEEFLKTLEVLTDSRIRQRNSIEVLTNGERFYESELQAIRQAQHSVNLEAYIFQRGDVGCRFLEALAERARAGVKVNLLMDSLGSAGMHKENLSEFCDAGGKFAWYHPLWSKQMFAFNNRTHRE